MRQESSGKTLQATALVHEVFLRLVEVDGVSWQDRAHFFGVSAQMMRRLHVDRARAQIAKMKRDPFAQPVEHSHPPTAWRRQVVSLAFLVAAATVASGSARPEIFTDLATPFETVAIETAGQDITQRVAAVRKTLDPLLPGVYAAGAGMNQRIAKALVEFPSRQAGYDRAVRAFPIALSNAVKRFRTVFPQFTPPLPIFLYHSLGMRDGGSDYLEPGHRLIMFFGADMIAALHADSSLEPFFDHELFHLEHAHAFPDCDQFWCVLWQEGLAVDAAATMTPGATDHQLLLDTPAPMRAPTDARWEAALCFAAAHFDDTDDAVIAQALQGSGKPPSGLPDRFGYYLGYRLARATGRPIYELDRLDHEAARRLLRSTLIHAMVEARAGCPAPAAKAAITHNSPHAV